MRSKIVLIAATQFVAKTAWLAIAAVQKLVNAGCKQTFAAGRPKVRYGGHALNRSAIGALVVDVSQNKDLLRGFRCWVCAVGRGDFASIDRGHSE